MKNLILFVLILVVTGCNQKEKNELNMTGAYSMATQVINDGTKDSAIDRKQLKIFTDRHAMYASSNLTDSFANYAIARYTTKDGKVIENILHSSANRKASDSVVLQVEKDDKGFRQIIENVPYDGKNYRLTEEYNDVGQFVKSPLDGAWKQTKNIYIRAKGDSSVNNNPIEYKVYQSGYFIWAITAKDSARNDFSVFGYGVFEMDGKNKSRETIKNSTFVSGLVGKTYEVDLEFPGKDAYKQTITFANGDKSVEIYQKLK